MRSLVRRSNGGIELNIDLNQIEAMTTNELEAHYGRLETEVFRLKVSLSVVSLELEARIKSRRITPIGIEETTASGDTRLTLNPWEKMRAAHDEETTSSVAKAKRELRNHREGVGPRSPRSDIGSKRDGQRGLDTASCCGAKGRRMNTVSLDCFECREVVE